MLRTPLIRSRARLCAPRASPVVSQLLLNRSRAFADIRRPDETVLPGSQSDKAVSDVPEPPKLGAETPASPIEGAPIGIPRAPP
ncbi:hypothetical protein KCU91_g10716, partial [Aureobasidium melanogenum]